MKIKTEDNTAKIISTTFVVIALFLFASFLLFRLDSKVAGLNNFEAGNIISDAVMSNKNSMSENDIQAFLKSKNPCNDTNLGKVIRLNETTGYMTDSRGVVYYYNISNGHFVCMADDSFNGESAAHIIWQAAQDYGINPQVLIVLLQKEQGLITDTWPNSIQYRSATGYGCPDTAACDSQYYGLKNQIRNAAALFREVLDGGWSNYPVGTNFILYNPDRSCGGTNVYIQNRATSALYRYTPYQPNQAALDAGWGTAHCGAYGNRNFYLYFTSWFGPANDPFVPMVMPRWMQIKDSGSYKYNVFTGEIIGSALTKGEQVLAASKIDIDNKTYIRTNSDTLNNLSQGIKLTDVEEITYEPMLFPRWMRMNRDAYKQIPRTGYNIDEILKAGRAISFKEKITINGNVYLRTTHDSTFDNDKGIPMIFLQEVFFEPLIIPRYMNIINPTSKLDLGIYQKQDSMIPSQTQFLFISKIQLDNTTYLRTSEDTLANNWLVIPIGEVQENSFIPMVIPRTMVVNKPSNKYSTLTTEPINSLLSQDQEIKFKSKIFVNGQWYLRSEVDTNCNIPYGILLSDLNEISL